MPTVASGDLSSTIRRVLVAAGAPDGAAGIVAESLVLSDLKGVDSHGLIRVAQYVREIEEGLIRPAASPVVERRGGLVHVDGSLGFGQVAAREAALLAADAAVSGGTALATVASVRHVGRLGEYVELASARGRVALAFCNSGPRGGSTAPFGGRTRIFGTNPLAYAIPTGSGVPVMADFATSATAEGKLRLARQSGLNVAAGCIVDAYGNPSEDPADFYAGGALLPAGGHRGYALALLAEILGGVVAGAGCASTGADPGNGLVLIVLGGGVDTEEVDRVVKALRAAPPAPGTDRVLVPGDPEAAAEAERRAGGIPVQDATWDEFVAVAATYGVAVT